MFWVALHFPGLPTGLEPLAAWACQFTPRVALEPPDALVAEVEGSLRYFGGREALFAALEAGVAELELPAEVTHAEGLLFAARRLLVQLEGLLTARHAGVRAFTLGLAHNDRTTSVVQVQLASPARDAERLSQLLREKLSTLALAQPVE